MSAPRTVDTVAASWVAASLRQQAGELREAAARGRKRCARLGGVYEEHGERYAAALERAARVLDDAVRT